MCSGDTRNEHVSWDMCKQGFWLCREKHEWKRTALRKVLREVQSPRRTVCNLKTARQC